MFNSNFLSIRLRYEELSNCLNKPKGGKGKITQFLIMNSYPHQIQFKLVIKMLFLQPNRMSYVVTILSVLFQMV